MENSNKNKCSVCGGSGRIYTKDSVKTCAKCDPDPNSVVLEVEYDPILDRPAFSGGVTFGIAYVIGKEDVQSVASFFGLVLNDNQLYEVMNLYSDAQNNDKTATWDLVVEQILYDLGYIENTKNKQINYKL